MINEQRGLERFTRYLHEVGYDVNPHQVDGLKWCMKQERHLKFQNGKFGGGLVADEMGLGKTILMIGTMLANPDTKTLIILPPILIQQWAEQMNKVSEMNSQVLVYHGSKRHEFSMEDLTEARYVIASYNALLEDVHYGADFSLDTLSVLHTMEWGRVIFDEAHHMRNPDAKRSIAADYIEREITWLITGTPIHNKIGDIVSLCDKLQCKREEYDSNEGLELFLEKHMLRRTKNSVGIKMPKLTHHVISVPWQTREEQIVAQDLHSKLGCLGTNAANNKRVEKFGKMCSYELMLRLKQLCVFPQLLTEQIDTWIDEDQFNDYDIKLMQKMTESTSKIDCVIDTLTQKKDNGAKKLVFCQFHAEIDILKERLCRNNLYVESIDGRTNIDERSAILKSSPTVLILQIQSGCEGLNLQQYSEVYFVSPHWNPAVEDQAIARCHRIGQQRNVEVYHFEMTNFQNNSDSESESDTDTDTDTEGLTLDAYCNEVQNNKRQIAQSILIIQNQTEK